MKAKSVFDQFFFRCGFYRALILSLLSLFCLNVAVISMAGSYDIRFGFLHLTAHELFKPILMMNGCFLIALMIGSAGKEIHDAPSDFSSWRLSSPLFYRSLFASLVLFIALAIYYPSVYVNFYHHDWTHRHLSAGKDTLLSTWQFFTTGDPTGFYRPLGFISLWLDYRLFGTAYEGYHVQSIALHIVNSLLVAWLAIVLGLGRKCSFWAGLLFAAAAVNFEAVVWPAARFDLSATAFTLLALIFAIRYFRDSRVWAWALPASLFCYVAGILSKESGYCFPLLILFLIGTYSMWGMKRPAKAKLAVYGSLMAVITALMVLVRIAVYGNLGGYGITEAAGSAHFRVSLKTFTSLLRAIPIPIFGVNSTPAAPAWMYVGSILLGVLIFLSAIVGRGCFRRKEYALLACLLLALVPVLNIVGWIGSSMLHSRYLYMPAVFAMLLIASTFSKIRWSAGILGAFLVVNVIGVASNDQAFHNMLAKTESIADSIRLDWERQPTVRTICLVNLPDSLNGAFYFGSEVVERIRKQVPAATVVRKGTHDTREPNASIQLTYRWSDGDQTLYLVGQP